MTKWKIKVETDVADISHIRLEDRKIVIVSFQLKGAVSPEAARDLAKLLKTYIVEFVKPEKNELLAVSGRGPIWLFLLLQHELHGAVANFGAFDPKVGIVVTATHYWDSPYNEGCVIEVPDEVRAQLIQ